MLNLVIGIKDKLSCSDGGVLEIHLLSLELSLFIKFITDVCVVHEQYVAITYVSKIHDHDTNISDTCM